MIELFHAFCEVFDRQSRARQAENMAFRCLQAKPVSVAAAVQRKAAKAQGRKEGCLVGFFSAPGRLAVIAGFRPYLTQLIHYQATALVNSRLKKTDTAPEITNTAPVSVISAAHLVFFKAVLVTLGTVSLKPIAESVKPVAGLANCVLGFASFGTEFVNAVARNAKSRNRLQTFRASVEKARPQH